MLTEFCHAYVRKRHTRKWNSRTAKGIKIPVREESHVTQNERPCGSNVESAGM